MSTRAMMTMMGIGQLEAELERLAAETTASDAWATLGRTDQGKKILDTLKEEREAVRSSYAAIIPHEAGGMVMLAGLQGEERKLNAMILRIESAESYARTLDEELKFIQSLIQQKRQLDREQR